jgi:hypothetical protein
VIEVRGTGEIGSSNQYYAYKRVHPVARCFPPILQFKYPNSQSAEPRAAPFLSLFRLSTIMYFTFIVLLVVVIFAIVWFGTRAKKSADEPSEDRYPEPDDNLKPRP